MAQLPRDLTPQSVRVHSTTDVKWTLNDNKPIYRRIVDYAFAHILSGAWPTGEMIPFKHVIPEVINEMKRPGIHSGDVSPLLSAADR